MMSIRKEILVMFPIYVHYMLSASKIILAKHIKRNLFSFVKLPNALILGY